ncbi:MAG TPA: DUF1064 domain-containing protein [Pseudogracilibacillus sp.]|nr:DUF1064 domain-containing protein [Pseudogracilibacillus sp.]
MEVISAKDFLKLNTKKSRKRKYNNNFVELDGYIFASQLEADYYAELVFRQKANEISSFVIQPRYLLQKSFEKDGKKYKKIEYVADFEIKHLDDSIEVIDTKGVKTDVFRIKEKMFHKIYPYKLTIVTK